MLTIETLKVAKNWTTCEQYTSSYRNNIFLWCLQNFVRAFWINFAQGQTIFSSDLYKFVSCKCFCLQITVIIGKTWTGSSVKLLFFWIQFQKQINLFIPYVFIPYVCIYTVSWALKFTIQRLTKKLGNCFSLS